ncbi:MULTISPECIES: hypothetical protein [Microcystis]|jgi:hypothetical protein|uniref:Uncharacterized protein n=2 Tax=Microcystis TaxID=1125 RepID=A0A5J5LW50_MICAE|nr:MULTISPECIES: hypothetical protein [Microcystis]KAB0242024.1 hypothetical protein EZJ55_17180 [Microcystis aeruginosa EAWAG127a]MDB9405855.1 hypothetical protein [Microcystis sp. CS-574]ODV35636.1 hypothetical protein BFG60_4947 [Microcystis aeruginosa NIES-98]
METTSIIKRKKPALASFLSLLLLGGGGLFYVGQRTKGFWMLIFLIASALGFYSFGISLLFVLIMGAGDAGNIAQIEGKNTFFPILFSLLILGGGGHFLLKKPRRGILFILTAILVNIPIIGGFFALILGMKESYGMAIRKNNFGSLKTYEYTWDYQSSIVKNEWQISQVFETWRTEKRIGDESRIIDNSSCRDSSINRSIKVSKQWRQTYELEHENAHSLKSGKSVQADKYVTYTKQIEDNFRQKYSISLEENRTFEDMIQIEVKPGRVVTLHISWKKIIQQGYVNMFNIHNPSETIQIPFSAVVDLAFDLKSDEL